MATRPSCPDCGTELACTHCDDNRPTAEDIYAGCRLLTPFDRWELVEKVDQPGGRYGPVLVWTKELTAAGAQRPWSFPRWRKVGMRRPESVYHGTPEIRVVEHDYRDGAMYAAATKDTNVGELLGDDGVLVMAHQLPGKGAGWEVVDHPAGHDTVKIHCDSKAEARSHVRRLARAYARAYGVKLTLPAQGPR